MFNQKWNRFYKILYSELRKQGMEPAALLIATAFKDRGELSDIELGNIVAGRQVGLAPPQEVRESISDLKKFGYIWQATETSAWQPSIPSLMTWRR